MTKTAHNILAKPLIRIASKELGVRICYLSSRAVSTIQKMPDGRYVVVNVYDKKISEYDKYSEARSAAEKAPMVPFRRRSPLEAPDSVLQVCHKAGRAISTIQLQPDGKWMVVKLYEEDATKYDEYLTAEEVAASAAMQHAPRTTKDAA